MVPHLERRWKGAGSAGLPVEEVLEPLLNQLHAAGCAVLQAPPGAGKTTLVPLALLKSSWLSGTILVIQPRRIATYAAAARMAALLGESVGETVGYRTRFDSRVSSRTRIEVITDGIFLRRLQGDPALEGVSAVLFDEYHERTVAMDLGLSFAREAQAGLREDAVPLYLLVMSATMDGAQLSQWLQAPLLKSAGQQYPVELLYHPLQPRRSLPEQVRVVVLEALKHEGDVLVFLPGLAEIRQLASLLRDQQSERLQVHELHGSLSPERQREALLPGRAGQRKVVLATNIAETSVTIEGITIVIDSGLARFPRYDEGRGLNALVTSRISLASARQRQGRAGRLGPGICYRLWSQSDEASMAAFDEPAILQTDLVPVSLELAQWGASDPGTLDLLTQPRDEAWSNAFDILYELGACSSDRRLTDTGAQLSQLGLHPRLGRLLLAHRGGPLASAALAAAALLSEGDPLRFSDGDLHADIRLRLSLWQQAPLFGQLQKRQWEQIQKLIRQLARKLDVSWQASATDPDAINVALAASWPDRVAARRSQSTGYRLGDGRGLQLRPGDSLEGSEFLIVLDTAGRLSRTREQLITLACALSREQIKQALEPLLKRQEVVRWNAQRQAVEVSSELSLHGLVIDSSSLPRPWSQDINERVTYYLLQHIAEQEGRSLPWTDASRQLQARLQWLHQRHSGEWPDMSDETLLSRDVLEDWLGPALQGLTGLADLKKIDLLAALKSRLDWSLWTRLDETAPDRITLKNGEVMSVDYSAGETPRLSARLQSFFGLSAHPCLPSGQPTQLELLSPARRPLQLTSDLPGFWAGSYKEVAKEMRGRYPKHPWPDDPVDAEPGKRPKPRR